MDVCFVLFIFSMRNILCILLTTHNLQLHYLWCRCYKTHDHNRFVISNKLHTKTQTIPHFVCFAYTLNTLASLFCLCMCLVDIFFLVRRVRQRFYALDTRRLDDGLVLISPKNKRTITFCANYENPPTEKKQTIPPPSSPPLFAYTKIRLYPTTSNFRNVILIVRHEPWRCGWTRHRHWYGHHRYRCLRWPCFGNGRQFGAGQSACLCPGPRYRFGRR